ncbi:ABC transporter substrate-binding protein [Limobrevibacterium gyesilva]|uniref:ABC transporter substrate-binding protein n=1 Tax=Limobrevibacterium gyesilva TaxID=2991712 RepID=A0AA41YKI3_9PROT|nr:ABC transporter substrate-binding protein [Limobrevibacterium gyesilva]MCW3473548.1 ABC transporter substrate-binding protein [Limobrevibacterium gyesilva]
MIRRHFTAGLVTTGLVGFGAASLPALAQAQTVPVGAIEILSGPAAAYGIAIKGGLDLALDEINQKGVLGGKKIALTVEDSAADKNQAINAARKLIGRDKVVAIIGPTLSNEMFAVGPVTNERKIPTIGTSTTANGITDIGPYIFRTSLPEADVVPVTFKKAQARGVKTVALMYANDDAFSKSGFDVMKAAAEKLGLNILAIESFGTKDTDFAAQLTKIKGLKPDAVAISALVEPVSGVLLQARQLGFGKETLFIGGNGSNSPKLGAIAGAAADGLIVGSPWFIGKPDALNQKFVAAFKAKYGKDPDQFAAQAYDCMFILAAAIDRAGAADSEKITAALAKTSYTGVMGPFTFTDHRDPASAEGVVVLEMRDGKFGIAP